VREKLPHLVGFVIPGLLILMVSALALAAAQTPAPPAPKAAASAYTAAEITSGGKIYAKQCEICHFSTSKAKKIGPGLANIYRGGKYANGKKVDDASMREWIEVGGKDMPGFSELLKPSEIRDLLAYLHTL
jgi:mono/diheme cytochrome c family protein